MSMHKSTPAGATLAFWSHGEKLPWQGRLPSVVQWVTCCSGATTNSCEQLQA